MKLDQILDFPAYIYFTFKSSDLKPTVCTERVKWKTHVFVFVSHMFLLVVKPWSLVFLGAHSLPLSPPRRERGGGAESLQGSSPPQAGAFWHWHNHTPTVAGCSTWSPKIKWNSQTQGPSNSLCCSPLHKRNKVPNKKKATAFPYLLINCFSMLGLSTIWCVIVSSVTSYVLPMQTDLSQDTSPPKHL